MKLSQSAVLLIGIATLKLFPMYLYFQRKSEIISGSLSEGEPVSVCSATKTRTRRSLLN
jgi:hypothetical protein